MTGPTRTNDPLDLTGATCMECGYDLTGLASCSCPECGRSIVAGEVQAQRRQRAYGAPSILGSRQFWLFLALSALNSVLLAALQFRAETELWGEGDELRLLGAPFWQIEFLMAAGTLGLALPVIRVTSDKRKWRALRRLWLEHAVWLHAPVTLVCVTVVAEWAICAPWRRSLWWAALAGLLTSIVGAVHLMASWNRRYRQQAEIAGVSERLGIAIGSLAYWVAIFNLAFAALLFGVLHAALMTEVVA